jgi:hypothetical protein
MDLDIPQNEYQEIERRIASDSSPVGIDAKETHIIIIRKLLEIESRLDHIERRLG